MWLESGQFWSRAFILFTFAFVLLSAVRLCQRRKLLPIPSVSPHLLDVRRMRSRPEHIS